MVFASWLACPGKGLLAMVTEVIVIRTINNRMMRMLWMRFAENGGLKTSILRHAEETTMVNLWVWKELQRH